MASTMSGETPRYCPSTIEIVQVLFALYAHGEVRHHGSRCCRRAARRDFGAGGGARTAATPAMLLRSPRHMFSSIRSDSRRTRAV